jgi:LCP family protein required for cell wall assembly
MSDSPPADEVASSPGEGESAITDAPAKDRRRHGQAKPVRSKRRKRVTRGLIALAMLVVVILGGSAIYLKLKLDQIHTVSVKVTKQTGPADNILLVGSTSRCAVTSSAQVKLFHEECLQGVNGVNSDVIMILRLQPGKTPTLLSIPRDTFVPDARSGGLYNKVDAALADGPNQLVDAIQQDFGIPINHYVVLNFGTFESIVNALGGISMYFPTTLRDFSSNLSIDKTGCVHIDGTEALALVRARHLNYHYDKKTKTWLGYDGSGDIGRIERVHLFLKALAAEISARGVGNPITDSKLLAALAPDLTVDQTFSTASMLSLALQFHGNVGSAPEYTLPVVEDTVDYMYKGYNYLLVTFPTEPQDQKAIAAFLGKQGSPKPLAPTGITVSVVDGTSSASATATTASKLSALGYKVLGTGSQVSVGPISETTVIYSAGKTDAATATNLARAEQVKSSLAGLVVLGEGPTIDGADVSVITGSAFSVATSSTATTTAQTSTATTHTTVIATLLSAVLDAAATSPTLGATFSSPTAASEKIPPYDPRVCPTKSK